MRDHGRAASGHGHRLRGVLGARSAERLLIEARQSPRAAALYFLAVRTGLSARECAALDVIHVSEDGMHVRDIFEVSRADRRLRSLCPRRFSPGPDVVSALAAYLAWRKGRCAHFRLPLRTVRDRAGIERCHACHEIVDFLASPLFVGRGGARVHPQTLRNDFLRRGRRLRLPPGLRFASMKRLSTDTGAAGGTNVTDGVAGAAQLDEASGRRRRPARSRR